MTKNIATLVLVCKRPALHQGKQRLAETIGAEKAFSIAQHLLQCALEDLSDWAGAVVISPSHSSDVQWSSTLLERDFEVVPQSDGNLGKRLNLLDRELRAKGHNALIYIGSDAPILSNIHFHEILTSLESNDVVFCPSSDGGVTIMACNRTWPDMTALPWSTDKLGTSLTDLCLENQLSVNHTSPAYDIDIQEHLYRLVRDLKEDERPARKALVSEIHQLMKTSYYA
ncbi:TIGR04282 family arsenosugar biosynthesis glycosyltransferase [Enterovibrio baiacu]|uniref:TIGR04282 family arsenosugar biosynthesis glycosyltransferase n=1 Tax=Enterovibrio baiacu TaxID=2491023 RepID=UPI00138702A0|nr:DUF2064 domain-containing protein [Enterovibrio baiacu]